MGITAAIRKLVDLWRATDHATATHRMHVWYLRGTLMAHLTPMVGLLAILRMLGGPGFQVAGAATVGLAGGLIAYAAAGPMLRPTLRWFAVGTEPSPKQRAAAIALPLRHTLLRAGIWMATGIGIVALHARSGSRMVVLIAVAVVLTGAANCFAGYLFVERVLRPVFIVALAHPDSSRRPRHGVAVRLLVTWALFTGVPLFGIAAIIAAQYLRLSVPLVVDNRAPVLTATMMGIGAGIVGMTLAARAVADPVRDVTRAMERITAGDTTARTRVYDISEIGLLQTGFNAMAEAVAEREKLHDLFGRHVGREVALQALTSGTDFAGRLPTVAVLFIDLSGSTSFAATNPPDQVAALLNDFFRLVVTIVDNHGGFVNKFEGDAALAIFGAPGALRDPAGAALAAARTLRTDLESLPKLPGFGIGIAYGEVFAGNIGAENRYEYTVIGDPVNIAARLSDLAKTRPGRTLAAADAVSAAGAVEAERWHDIDTVTLRGRSTATVLAAPEIG